MSSAWIIGLKIIALTPKTKTGSFTEKVSDDTTDAIIRVRSGKTIFPLEIALGLQRGFTPAAANTVGRQFASTGSSQGRTIGFVKDHLGCAIGSTRLRKLGKHLAAEMEPFREQCQFEQLQQWLAEARKTNAKSIVVMTLRHRE